MWGGEAAGTYWEERYFLDRVLNNYRGSVYLIQGMHDWNVDPHMAVPVINQLKDSGIEAKGLFGQWDHDYPDSCLLYTSPSPRDKRQSRMPSSA